MAPAIDPEHAPRRRAPYRKPEQVKAALLAATLDLLADRLPRDLTVREIAAAAGTQHSMITRHFGSKQALVAEAVGSVAEGYAGAVTAAPDAAAGFVAALAHLRSLPVSAMVLTTPAADRSGDDPEARFPGYAAHLRQMLDAGAPDDLRTRVAAGMVLALVVAWNLFDDTLVDAAGIDPADKPEVEDLAAAVLADLVRATLPAAAAAPAADAARSGDGGPVG